MPSFFTRAGDDGTTGLLGEGRVPKYDLRLEALGTVDEASAALGMARALCKAPETAEIVLRLQRDLYGLMAELAATPENAKIFRFIEHDHVLWLEEQTERLSALAGVPSGFIVPGDALPGAAFDLARTVVRRAERRVTELAGRGDLSNAEVLHYLNRLSSLVFVIELRENQVAGFARPTLAKGK